MPETYDLRLVVHFQDGGYKARWIEPGGQETETFPLDLPLDESGQEDLRWYLEDYPVFVGAGDRVLAAEREQQIDGWGRTLFEALFESPEGARVHLRLMDAASERPAVLTLGSKEAEFHVQPWELMRDRRGPLVFQGVTVRRQLLGAGAARRPTMPLPLRVLLITSRPKEAGFIDPRTSVAPMLDALDALPGQVTVDYCEPPTLGRLEEMISVARREERPFHIVHFDGHGTYLPETGVGALAFERDDSGETTHLVEGRKLGDVLTRLDVPVVLLEACRSSALSHRPVFGSVAPALLESGVGSVIAFSHSVHVEAARLLVERFYQELAHGRTVGQALEEARVRLRAEPARWLTLGPDPETVDLQDWFIPQLYQVGADPSLVTSDGDAATEVAPSVHDRTKDLHGFPPEPMYRFHGRALELLELERALRRVPAVLLTAMGGMGKTALAREAAAWWLRQKRFEAAVFHSFEQKAGAERVVQVLGQALEGDDFSSRSAKEQWTSAVDLFHQRKVLFVWDNFESTLPEFQKGEDSPLEFSSAERRRLRELYRELTEGDPAGRLLVTCRPRETGLAGLKEIEISGLARPDSLHLLSEVLYRKDISTDRDGYDRDAIDALLKTIDDHPLSISLVAPHLKTLRPAQIRDELREGLERFADGSAEEERNRSLLASLAFSTRRLSEEARGVLPFLAWFEGGVFENYLTVFAELDAGVWETIRGELVATALIRLEEHPWFNTPFLRFHPTLPFAARAEDVGDVEAVETRFIAVYLSVMKEVDQALDGRQPAFGMALLALEESNCRSALRRAFRRGSRQKGARMSETLGKYLERAGRVRERDDFVEWVRSQLPEDAGLDEAAYGSTLLHAQGLLSQGRADEAIATVKVLIARLEAEGLVGGEDPAFQIGTSYQVLSRAYIGACRHDLALEPSRRAIARFEGLPGDLAKNNLAVALVELAGAYRVLGQFDEALAVAERGLAIHREQSSRRGILVALGGIASILCDQQRYAQADIRFGEALDAARAVGDLVAQGTILRNQAIMQNMMGNHGPAIKLGKEAFTILQEAGHDEGEMAICEILGTAERQLDHLDAADAWYERARELAEKTNNRSGLAMVAQNVGVLHGVRAEQAGDPKNRDAHLRRARSLLEESLAIRLGMNDQVKAASSYLLLGVLHRTLEELDRAEENLQQSLRIHESLNLPDVWRVYGNLAEVAHARGDAKAAAEWQAKCDAKVAELERLRRGDSTEASVPVQLLDAILKLARAVHDARVRGVSLPADASEALAQLSGLPAPLGAVGVFLRDVAGGASPSVPSGLPSEVGEILEGLLEALG